MNTRTSFFLCDGILKTPGQTVAELGQAVVSSGEPSKLIDLVKPEALTTLQTHFSGTEFASKFWFKTEE